MEEIEMHVNINTAFDRYTTSWCSIDKTSATKVLSQEVLLEIDKIYNYIFQYSVDWKIDTMKIVLERLESDLKIMYPFLNNKSIETLKNYFSYEWK